MSDNDSGIGKILGYILAIMTIIAILIQINKDTNFINIIKLFIVNSWVWFIRIKIPLFCIPIGIFLYYLVKNFLKDKEAIKTIKRENIGLMNLLDDKMYRAIILYCDEPRHPDQIFTEISKNFRPLHGTWNINAIIRNLEERDGLMYIEEYNLWQSTVEARDIIIKYHRESLTIEFSVFVEYLISTTSDWTTFSIESEEKWEDQKVEILLGGESLKNPPEIGPKRINLSKNDFDPTPVKILLKTKMIIPKNKLDGKILYVIKKGDINSTTVDIKVENRLVEKLIHRIRVSGDSENRIERYVTVEKHLKR